ncbi:MAG: methyl-accepting chemotaxis protein [Methanoregula sp.]|nr:methyl-accepting chemotaxis protein [Methanoregula sp.]
MELSEIESTLKKVIGGDTGAHLDENAAAPELRSIAKLVNQAIEKIVEGQETKDRADAMIRDNPLAIAVLRADKSRISINKQYEVFWRGTREELMKKKLYDFDIKVLNGVDFYQCFETKKLAHTEAQVSWPDGVIRYLNLDAIPIFDKKGNLDGAFYVWSDVTELHQKMEEVREAQSKVDRMIADNPLAIAVLRADKSRISINKQYEVFWRGSYEELMKKKLYDFDIKVLNGVDFYQCFETKKLAHTEAQVSWPDGVVRYLNLDAIPLLDGKGNLEGAFYVWSDVTELHQKMEEVAKVQSRVERMIADNPLAIAVLRADKSRISINKQYEVFWRGTREELMKKKLYDFDIKILNGVDFYQCFETKKLAHTEALVSWQDGVTRYLNLDAIPIFNEKGNLDGAFYVWSDVTSVVKTRNYAAHEIDELARLYGIMAKGDLTVRYEITEPDADVQEMYGQIVKLRDAVREIVTNLQHNIGDVNRRMEGMVRGSENATSSIEDASKGVQQIAKNVTEVSELAEKSSHGVEQVQKAMQDMSTAVEEITSSMETVSGLSKEANDLSENGAKLAGNAEKSMAEISTSSAHVAEIVLDVERQMGEISKIVVLIRDLASQTNLLALNAAIEAARAGDAGRGFAVVATEVKSLAQESRNSAERIEEMISGLRKSTQKASAAMADSKNIVEQGSAMVTETLQSFNKIAAAVEKVVKSASEVAAATEEQAATTEEITASVHEVAGLVGQTAKEAGDAAAASEEASAAIDEISGMIQSVDKLAVETMEANKKFKVE